MACNHDCEHCASNSGCGENVNARENFAERPLPENKIKKVIGIVSGKGGVGKSLVTGLLAVSMRKKNYSVGILDADITGPSIPKMFGITQKAMSDGISMLPAVSKSGIKIMSMNMCLPDENDPVVWRGPVLAGVVKQFWNETGWGALDYMFIDMPPGTGDVPLTIFQSIPVNGIIVVTTPQDLVSMIVNKALKMADLMNIPVLGLVENMSYFECDNCGKRHYIFGRSDYSKTGIEKISELPLNLNLAKLCDAGEIESYDTEDILSEMISALS